MGANATRKASREYGARSPRESLKLKSSEVARNGSKTTKTEVNFFISSLSSDEILSSYSTKPMASRKTDPRTSEVEQEFKHQYCTGETLIVCLGTNLTTNCLIWPCLKERTLDKLNWFEMCKS